MFEKEAEEYAERTKTEKEIEVLNTVHYWGQESLSPDERRLFEGIQDRKEAREQGFQKGADFGFNKAKEEADKMKSRFLELCNLKDMRIKELEKANEWHYVKDGDLPKFDEGTEIKFMKGRFMKAKQIVICLCEDDDLGKVITWKGIVPPELPKESE